MTTSEEGERRRSDGGREGDSEAEICKKFSVKIFKPWSSEEEEEASSPSSSPKGITVFLPGTYPVKLESYRSTYQVVTDHPVNQIVVGFMSMNPFPIVGGRSHEQMAKDVATVVKELRQIKEYQSLGPKYNIIGHSLGGKVALMVAAKYDIEHVHTVIALDPVDDRPQELTFPKAPHRPTTDLANSKTSAIHLFQSDTGRSWFPIVPKTKNATVIRSMYPHQITSLTINKGAGHMSYLDSWSDDASILTRVDVHEKIRSTIG